MTTVTKRKFAKYFLIASVAGLVVGTPLAYFGGKYYLKQRTHNWRVQGIEASKSGDNERGADLLLLYLKRIPDDPEALTFYIKSREAAELPNGGHLAETIRAEKMLLGLDPERVEDRRHLLDLYVRIQRRPEALDVANAILAKLPNDPRTLGIKSQILESLGQNREAIEVAQKWVAVAPDDIHARLTQLECRFRSGQTPATIIADVEQLQSQNSDDPKYQFLLGSAYASAGINDKAIQSLKSAANHPNLDADFVNLLVAQFDNLGASADAVAVMQNLVTRGAGTDIRHLLARHLWQQGQWEQAAQLLSDISPTDAHADITLLALRVFALVSSGKTADAAPIRDALAHQKLAEAQAWTQLSRRLIDNAPVKDSDIVTACRQALTLDPHNSYLLYYLGETFSRLGEQDLALGAWQDAILGNPSWSLPAIRMVETLGQKGQPDQAFDLAAVLSRRNSTNAAFMITLAKAWADALDTGHADRPDELLKLTNEILTQIPGEEQTSVLRIRLLAKKGDKAEATSAARALLAKSPAPAEQTFVAIAGISRTFSLGIEAECLALADKTFPSTPQMAYAHAVDRFLSSDAAKGLALFDELAAKAGTTKSEADKAWKLTRARYLDLATPGSKEAKSAFAELGQTFPTDLAIQNAITSARSVRNDWDVMLPTIDRIRDITSNPSRAGGPGSGLSWRLIQSRLYVEAPRTDADVSQGALFLSKLTAEFPQLPEPKLLLARALIQMNRYDGASEQLADAAKIQPNSAPIALGLADVLLIRGETAAARSEIDRLLNGKLLRTTLDRRHTADLLVKLGDAGAALKLMEQENSGNGSPDLFMANLYRQQHNIEKADAIVHDLLSKPNIAAGPDLTTIQYAIDYYLSQGRRPDAEAALARLDGLPQNDGTREYIRGNFLRQVGDLSAAAAQFAAAVQKSPQNASAWRMLATLQFSLQSQANASIPAGAIAPATASGPAAADPWATLEKAATALPSDKGFAAIAQNKDLLRKTTEDTTLLSQVTQLIGEPLPNPLYFEFFRVLVEERDSMDMDRLAARLQQFIDRHPDFLPPHLRLALIYATMNRPGDALAAAQRALTAFPTSILPAQLATELCARDKKWDAMQAAAETWKKRAAGTVGSGYGTSDAAPDIAIARALNGQGKYDAAINQLKPWLSASTSNHVSTDLIAVYCVALANSGKIKTADDLLWPSTKDAAGRALWMSVAVGIEDTKEAAAWLDRVLPLIPPLPDGTIERISVIEAYDSLGRRTSTAGTADPNNPFTQKASTLARQLAEDPKASITALVVAADQAGRNGDNSAAETYYRHAISLEPRLWFANNNLAMLILQRNGDPKEASLFAQSAAKSAPRNATVQDTYAQSLARAKEFTAAAKVMTAAVQLEPETAKWRVRLASYLLSAGDSQAAAKELAQLDNAHINTTQLIRADQETFTLIKKQLKRQ